MLFETWSQVGFVGIATAVTYAALLVVLRVSGKRTLSKLNAFDLVVTIAFGSMLASAAVSLSVPVLDAVVGIAVLAGLQVVVALGSRQWGSWRRLVTSEPTLVLWHGELLVDRLAHERVRVDDIAQAVRTSGAGSFGGVAAVVLETDGSLSVIADLGDGSALTDVRGVPATALEHLASARIRRRLAG